MNLEGRAALITGGRRVGAALALRLADRGMDVALTYRHSREAIEATVREVEARGVRGLAVAADLAHAGPAERAVAQTVAAFGRIDALVNMASVYRLTPFDSLTPADFDEMIATNLAPAYFTSVAAARAMRRQAAGAHGLKGKIVTVGDWATERPGRDVLPYITAKGALAALTMALAKELAPEVTVNLVQPGTVEPPPDTPPETLAQVIGVTPLARTGSPDDVNGLILYLLEGTDFATGGCYRVDGGRFLGMDTQDV
jgi:pteridine reductase